MNAEQLERYSRHILLKEMGEQGQAAIARSRVLVIGAGGLGSPAAYYLASGGVGTLTLVDDDIVELTNLQRQILHTTERIGMNKALSGREMLRQINPLVHVIPVTQRAAEPELEKLVQNVDLVLDCTDNFVTRHRINRICFRAGVPLVSGAAVGFDGQISVYDPRQDRSPCYACLYPENQRFEDIRAAQVGVFAPLVGIIGTTQAAEALKLLSQVGTPLTGTLLLLNALQMEWTRLELERDPQCPVCSHRPA